MNAWQLQSLVSTRLPGYTSAEYLDVCNEAYQELWAETQALNVDYFTDIGVVTVATQAREFDLRYNLGAALNAALHPKIYQIQRVRILQPNSASWLAANPRDWTNSADMSQEQDSTSPPYTTAPYYYQIYGRGLLRFARPLLVGTNIEVNYTIGFFELVSLSAGSVASSGVNVTGTTTTFTQLLPPDFDANYLPGPDIEADIEADLVANPTTTPLIYRVVSVTSDTALTLMTAPNPALSAAPYALASVPDTPESWHRLIVDIATRNLLAHPAIANDGRFSFWDSHVERALARYRDAISERQHQEAQKRQRFPYGAVRRSEYEAR